MAVGQTTQAEIRDHQWYIVGRWQEYEGEARANLLRIIGIAAFYPRHPTQLYEFAFHALAAIGLASLQRRQLLRGQLIKFYIIGYLAYRFAMEFIRPEPVLYFGLTGYQLASLGLVPVFFLLWIQDGRRVFAQEVMT